MEIHKEIFSHLVTWVVENKTPLGHAFAGGVMAILRCIYQEETIKKTLAEGCMCAFAAFCISEILLALEWETELALPASVFLGYIGIASVLKIIKFRMGISK